MKNLNIYNNKRLKFHNGEYEVIFDIIYLTEKEIKLAITIQGKISVTTYEILEDSNGAFFEYGIYYSKIYVNEFLKKNNTIYINYDNYKINDIYDSKNNYDNSVFTYKKPETPTPEKCKRFLDILKKMKGENNNEQTTIS